MVLGIYYYLSMWGVILDFKKVFAVLIVALFLLSSISFAYAEDSSEDMSYDVVQSGDSSGSGVVESGDSSGSGTVSKQVLHI